MNHQCDRQTNGQNCDSNSVRLTMHAKAELTELNWCLPNWCFWC